jgi:molecular chaperone GrpE
VIAPEAREEIEAALSALRQWLLEAERWRDLVEAPKAQGPQASPVDLHTLLEEWIALRQEVRLESRSGKANRQELERAVDEFHQGIDQVQSGVRKVLDPLVRERDRLRDDVAARLDAEQRSWAELLLDIREALARGEEASQQARGRLGFLRRWLLPRGLFAGLLDGYAMALRRIDAMLASRDIRRIECLGQRVDPERMRVVDLVQREDLPEGHVSEVVREGYTCGSRVIRFAEVRAVTRQSRDCEGTDEQSRDREGADEQSRDCEGTDEQSRDCEGTDE